MRHVETQVPISGILSIRSDFIQTRPTCNAFTATVAKVGRSKHYIQRRATKRIFTLKYCDGSKHITKMKYSISREETACNKRQTGPFK